MISHINREHFRSWSAFRVVYLRAYTLSDLPTFTLYLIRYPIKYSFHRTTICMAGIHAPMIRLKK